MMARICQVAVSEQLRAYQTHLATSTGTAYHGG